MSVAIIGPAKLEVGVIGLCANQARAPRQPALTKSVLARATYARPWQGWPAWHRSLALHTAPALPVIARQCPVPDSSDVIDRISGVARNLGTPTRPTVNSMANQRREQCVVMFPATSDSFTRTAIRQETPRVPDSKPNRASGCTGYARDAHHTSYSSTFILARTQSLIGDAPNTRDSSIGPNHPWSASERDFEYSEATRKPTDIIPKQKDHQGRQYD